MSSVSDDVLSKKLAGIQLALFELIWPSFTWIEGIYVTASSEKCFVYVQADEAQPDSEWNDCVRLLSEIFDSVLGDSRIRIDVVCNKSQPIGSTFKEVMSQTIFKMIAKEVAPWRLDVGR